MKTINEIKALYRAANIEMLPDFIHTFSADSRAGVRSLVEKAKRCLAQQEEEKKRIQGMKQYERQYAHCALICGIDEAGRGPLAGPVVAGAVILPKDCEILYVNDSKKLTPEKREELYHVIMEEATAVGVGYASPARIDEINILQATYEAMREAIGALGEVPDVLLNDAVFIPDVEIKQVSIVKGDAKSLSIAAASIIAKVSRDRLMMQYHEIFPMYGFDSHKGYGSATHREALLQYGLSPIHRRSFCKAFL